ncbi:hypothetical protein FQZ97_836560 [compost metagenome]
MAARQLIQVLPVLFDARLHRIGDRRGQEAQPWMCRGDAMQQGQVAAQFLAQRTTHRFQAAVGGQAEATGGAAECLHDEEVAADHRRITAQQQGTGHLHARLVDGAQYCELLFPAHAHRHRGRRVGTQHPAALGLPGTVTDAHLQQPVLLDRATGKALAAFDLDLLAIQQTLVEVCGQRLAGVGNVDPDRSGSMGMGAVHRKSCLVGNDLRGTGARGAPALARPPKSEFFPVKTTSYANSSSHSKSVSTSFHCRTEILVSAWK